MESDSQVVINSVLSKIMAPKKIINLIIEIANWLIDFVIFSLFIVTKVRIG